MPASKWSIPQLTVHDRPRIGLSDNYPIYQIVERYPYQYGYEPWSWDAPDRADLDVLFNCYAAQLGITVYPPAENAMSTVATARVRAVANYTYTPASTDIEGDPSTGCSFTLPLDATNMNLALASTVTMANKTYVLTNPALLNIEPKPLYGTMAYLSTSSMPENCRVSELMTYYAFDGTLARECEYVRDDSVCEPATSYQ